ncbi:MAG: MCP four helix bundle domain-containing protein, partial [Natronospirillum sp.]
MNLFRNLKIFTKLMSAFGIVLALFLATGIYALAQMASINDASTKLATNRMVGTQQAQAMDAIMGDFRMAELQHIMSQTEQGRARYEQQLEDMRTAMAAARSRLEPLLNQPEEITMYDRFTSAWERYQREHDQLLIISLSNDLNRALEFNRGNSRVLYDEIDAAIEEMVVYNMDQAQETSAQADALYAASQVTVITLLVVSILLGVGLAFLLARGITGAVKEAKDAATRLADGDLTVEITSRSNDELGQMMVTMKRMVDKLTQVIGEVRSGADNLASASEEVSATSQTLSQATSEQASSVEETTASMEQMTASISQNTENAGVTDGMSSKAAKEAVEGGEAVSKTVIAMKSIAEKISIIDDIAYQTNLL